MLICCACQKEICAFYSFVCFIMNAVKPEFYSRQKMILNFINFFAPFQMKNWWTWYLLMGYYSVYQFGLQWPWSLWALFNLIRKGFNFAACRDNLLLLRTRYYYATWKADGTRYMMLITVDGCFLIDRDFKFRRVQMRFPCRYTNEVCIYSFLLLGWFL